VTVTLPLPGDLLTVEEYVALGDDETLRWSELQEGNLVVSPSPGWRHQRACLRLAVQLDAQLSGGLVLVQDIDVDLQLAAAHEPGTVRQPDLVVVSAAEAERVERTGGILRASGVVLVAEVLAPGDPRTDRIIKRAEYADAGIGHYWLVDLDTGPSLTRCTLDTDGYTDDGPRTGVVTGEQPFGYELDLTPLI